MVEIKICENCREKFKTYHKNVKCCSRKCAGELRRGREPWNKGKEYSEETRKKISLSMQEQYKNGTRDRFEITKKANEKIREIGQPHMVGKFGESNNAWKGGRNITNKGYVRIRKFGGYILEHRFVWEQANGPIPEGFQIHHIDGDKTNNKLSNLQLLSNSEHQKLHNESRPRFNDGTFAG